MSLSSRGHTNSLTVQWWAAQVDAVIIAIKPFHPGTDTIVWDLNHYNVNPLGNPSQALASQNGSILSKACSGRWHSLPFTDIGNGAHQAMSAPRTLKTLHARWDPGTPGHSVTQVRGHGGRLQWAIAFKLSEVPCTLLTGDRDSGFSWEKITTPAQMAHASRAVSLGRLKPFLRHHTKAGSQRDTAPVHNLTGYYRLLATGYRFSVIPSRTRPSHRRGHSNKGFLSILRASS
ncbi:hypothetical protein EDB85DRAFT_2226065 [Lactarius pseudohatsudake]|nr:hypothetical protein EDB85DRAFT_2226065 [Lactarius pseudohatsudake]